MGSTVCRYVGDTRQQWQSQHMPCLTNSRGASGGFYVTSRQRRTTTKEMTRFQGFHPDELPWKEAKIARGCHLRYTVNVLNVIYCVFTICACEFLLMVLLCVYVLVGSLQGGP